MEVQRVGMVDLYNKHRNEFVKVVTLLEKGKTYKFINTFLATKGLEMSNPTLMNLKKKIQESKNTGRTLEDIINRRNTKSVTDVKKDKISGYVPKKRSNDTQYTEKLNAEDLVTVKNKVYSPRQILEEIMNKGFDTLSKVDYVDMPTALKAADLFNKYYGNTDKGLTSEAINSYQLMVNSTLSAMKEVLLEYVPEDKQAEVLDRMEQKRQEYLDNLGATNDGARMLREFDKANLTY